MSTDDRDSLLAEAVRLREQGEAERARERLVGLAGRFPEDVDVAYQTAWVHDLLGLEAEAVPYYVRALSSGGGVGGLGAEDRRGALLGLGSTYRVLGQYAKAVETLSRAVSEFPEDAALRTFLAMALFNTEQHHDAMRILLELLATTSQDADIQSYRRAIEHYAQDLNERV